MLEEIGYPVGGIGRTSSYDSLCREIRKYSPNSSSHKMYTKSTFKSSDSRWNQTTSTDSTEYESLSIRQHWVDIGGVVKYYSCHTYIPVTLPTLHIFAETDVDVECLGNNLPPPPLPSATPPSSSPFPSHQKSKVPTDIFQSDHNELESRILALADVGGLGDCLLCLVSVLIVPYRRACLPACLP